MKISKRKIIKLSILAAAFTLAVMAAACLLLLHRPASYIPPAQNGSNNNNVSTYLTHDLAPQFYNGLQKRQPFEMVVLQAGFNEIISRLQYPVVPDSISISEPSVRFSPEGLQFICAAQIKGVTSFITLQSMPCLDGNGLLNLNLNSIKIGAVPVTPFVRPAMESIIADSGAAGGEQEGDFASKIALALLENKPFDPVFTLDDKKIRITGISFENEKLTISFAPAGPQPPLSLKP